jgi:hypothetical protein
MTGVQVYEGDGVWPPVEVHSRPKRWRILLYYSVEGPAWVAHEYLHKTRSLSSDDFSRSCITKKEIHAANFDSKEDADEAAMAITFDYNYRDATVEEVP